MKDKSSPDDRILEAIELSDRGRDGPSDREAVRLAADRPELVELRRRSKRLDDALRGALGDVPVPEGLSQRILARLGQSPSAEPGSASLTAPHAAAPARLPTRSATWLRGFSRRHWMLASAGAVAIATFAGWCCWLNSDTYTAGQILDQAVAQFAPNAPPQGKKLSPEVLASFPPSREIRCPRDMRWRNVEGFLGRDAVAYEMVTPGGAPCTLFVTRCARPIAGLEASPPDSPQRATGGRAAAAWQTDGMLYVLVVAGDRRDYRSLLQPKGPIA